MFYELLTGISPFGRPSTAETLAAVLGTRPDYSILPPKTPAGMIDISVVMNWFEELRERAPLRRN